MRIAVIMATLLIVSSCLFGLVSDWQDNGIQIRQNGYIEWFRSATRLSDGSTVYTWSDTRNGDRDVYAQRVGLDGTNMWNNGESVLVCGEYGRQEDPVVMATSEDNLIFAWIDFRDSDKGDIRTQMLDIDGNLQWHDNNDGGVVLVEDNFIQISLNIVSDDNGGVFLIWNDQRNSGTDIYGAHIDNTGANLWTANGMPVAGGAGVQTSHTFRKDGQGGAVVIYRQVTSDSDLYARRFDANGNMLWGGTDGYIVLCDATMSDGSAAIQESAKLITLGNDTYGVAWRDRRNENSGDIYVQILDLQGNKVLSTYPQGMPLYVGPAIQENPRVATDGNGTMYVAWEDRRLTMDTTSERDIYVQSVASDGTINWNADGVVVSSANGHQEQPRLAPGASGDVYVIWDDYRNGSADSDVFLQRIDSTGNPVFAADGIALSSFPGRQGDGLLRTSTNGNVSAVWLDARNGSNGLYSMIIDTNGSPAAGFNADGNLVDWQIDGNVSELQLTNLSDGKVAFTWVDPRHITGNRLYVQYLDPATGTKIFMDDQPGDGAFEQGKPFTSDMGVNQKYADYAADTNGGIATVFECTGEGLAYPKIYAQAIDSNGDPLWGADPVEISNRNYDQYSPKIITLDDGSTIVGWSNMVRQGFSTLIYKVFAQKITNGTTYDAEGVLVAEIDEDGTLYDAILSDVVGEYFLFKTDDDVFVQRMDYSSMSPVWAEPLKVSWDSTIDDDDMIIQRKIKAIEHDLGLIVYWEDSRNDNGDKDIYANLITEDGTTVNLNWNGVDGTPLVEFVNDQYSATMLTNGNDIYLGWVDFRNGADNDIAMQKFSMTETAVTPEWTSDIMFAQADSSQSELSMIQFEEKVIACWADYQSSYGDIKINAIKDMGTNGLVYREELVLCDAYRDQKEPKIVRVMENTRSEAHALIGWLDARASGKDDAINIFAQRVHFDGVPTNEDVNSADFVLGQNYPNPFNPETHIDFSIKRTSDVELSIYNIKGQKVKTLVKGQLEADNYSITWKGVDNNDNPVASGMYFYKLNTSEKTEVKKMLLLK